MIHRLLSHMPDALYHRDPVPQDADVRIRYLGTAGFVIEGDDRTLVIDPFLTRPGLLTTGFKRLVPDEDLIKTILPTADDVLIGHAHHDHVLDGPSLCKQTGARFIGSPSACNVARAYGLPESQIRATKGREVIEAGKAKLRGLPSLHGKVYGRVPLPGEIPEPPPWPPRFRQLRHGLVLNWHVDIAGVKIVHIDSADYIDKEFEGLTADVVCLCAIGRQSRPGYTENIIEMLKPRVVIACHWDWFFTDYDTEPRVLPGVDMPGFIEEIRTAGAEPVVLPFEGHYGIAARP